VGYVCYPHEAEWLVKELDHFQVQIKYIALMAKKETLVKRDSVRMNQTGSRAPEVRRELLNSVKGIHLLSTDELTAEEAADTIISSTAFALSRRGGEGI